MSQVSDASSYQNSTQRLQDSLEAERAENRGKNEKELKKAKGSSEAEIAKTQKASNERLETERASARDQVKRLKEELYGQKGKSAASEARLPAERQVIRSQSQGDQQVERAVEAQKKSARQEVRALQEELGQYRTEGHDVEKERAKAKQQLIAENEGTQINERNRIVESYEQQIARMKNHQSEMEDHYDRRLTESAFDNSSKTRNQLQKQKSEFIGEAQKEGQRRAILEDTFKTELKSEQSRQTQASDQLITKNSADLEKAVLAKDQAYKDYLTVKDERVDYDLKTRDDKIKELETTNDPLKVSPFVIKRINDAAEKRYYAQLNEANHVNSLNLNAVRDRDVVDRQDLTKDYEAKFAGASRGVRKEIDVKDRTFLNSYEDMNQMHHDKEATLVQQKRDAVERMHEKQSLEVANTQKQKTEALEEQHDTLAYEKNTALDEANQSQKLQQREWALKTNDMRRNLQNQMTEERDQHEKVLSEIKLEFDKKLREKDRVSTRVLDDRVRAYEHQIKQQELSFREKERFLTEHYEEELDTMKRTNAHLIQKKS